MLGYSSKKEIIGKKSIVFYSEPEGRGNIIAHLKSAHGILTRVTEMKKKSKETVSVFNYCKLKYLDNNRNDYIGSVSLFEKSECRKALFCLPTGYYRVRTINNQDIIIDCNLSFAELFEYDSVEELCGMNIESLFWDPQDKDAVVQALLRSRKKEIYNVKARTKKNTPLFVEVEADVIYDENNKIIGRHGTVRDISKNVELKENFDKALKERELFIHEYVSRLLGIRSKLESVIELIAMQINYSDENNISSSHIPKLIKSREEVELSSIRDYISRIIYFPISDYRINNLINSMDLIGMGLRTLKGEIEKKVWSREGIILLYNIINSIWIEPLLLKEDQAHFQSEMLEIGHNIQELFKLYTLQLCGSAKVIVEITYKSIESIRQYLFVEKDIETISTFKCWNISRIIKKNIELYYDMAQIKQLEIKYKSFGKPEAFINKEKIDRMISNLILNAIKYSYKREGGYIEIISKTKNSKILITIENFGVPIMEDEIQDVFKFGYRGKLSSDREKIGSGIGLADAKNTVDIHGGTVFVQSRPASQTNLNNIYDVPHIVTITIEIPREGGKNKC